MWQPQILWLVCVFPQLIRLQVSIQSNCFLIGFYPPMGNLQTPPGRKQRYPVGSPHAPSPQNSDFSSALCLRCSPVHWNSYCLYFNPVSWVFSTGGLVWYESFPQGCKQESRGPELNTLPHNALTSAELDYYLPK